MRRGCCLDDVGPGTPAGVEATGGAQQLESLAVLVQALGLAHYGTVPVETKRGQVGELGALVLGATAAAVEILDPQDEGCTT